MTTSANSAAFRTVFSFTPYNDATDRDGTLSPENKVSFTLFSVDGRLGASGGDTDATDSTVISEKSLKARVLGNFPNYRCHRWIGVMRAPRREKKAPRRAWGARGSECDTGVFYAKGSSSSAGVRRRIPRQQRTLLFSRRVCVRR